MPAVYAHDRFGVKVREKMDEGLADIAEKYNSAYRTGLQGPDIFFFYHPWSFNGVQRYGRQMHHTDASAFFHHAEKIVREYGRDSSCYAYLLGFICHFALDGECHHFVDQYAEENGVAHLEIEAEFEKLLLREDGEDPLAYPLADLVFTDRETAAAIDPFFPSITEKMAQASLRGMRFVKNFFTAPQPLKQDAINAVMKLFRIYHSMNGLMLQRTDNPLCEESNQILWEKFDQAIPVALSLQQAFDDCLDGGKALPKRFHRDFE